MAERTRVFTGTTPEGQEVLVTMFEKTSQVFAGSLPLASFDWEIAGMEVATREGEGRFARWGVPTRLTEET